MRVQDDDSFVQCMRCTHSTLFCTLYMWIRLVPECLYANGEVCSVSSSRKAIGEALLFNGGCFLHPPDNSSSSRPKHLGHHSPSL